jgi:hypothetical protein
MLSWYLRAILAVLIGALVALVVPGRLRVLFGGA